MSAVLERPPTLADAEARVRRAEYERLGSGTTVCRLILDNGFVVHAETNTFGVYDEPTGRRLAREKAVQKVMPFLRFLAAERSSKEGHHC